MLGEWLPNRRAEDSSHCPQQKSTLDSAPWTETPPGELRRTHRKPWYSETESLGINLESGKKRQLHLAHHLLRTDAGQCWEGTPSSEERPCQERQRSVPDQLPSLLRALPGDLLNPPHPETQRGWGTTADSWDRKRVQWQTKRAMWRRTGSRWKAPYKVTQWALQLKNQRPASHHDNSA